MPWTISRDRPDGEPSQDLPALLGRIRSRAARASVVRRLAGAGANARRLGAVRSRQPRSPGPAPGARRPVRARWAIPLIALLTAAAVLLTWATVSLAQRGAAASRATASIRGGLLVTPAPRSAGNLPRRFGMTPNPADQRIMTRLGHRFAAVSDRLLAAASRADPARPVTANRPGGLYGQPGHLDPVTARPSWVVYLGMQSSAKLGSPVDTIESLMTGILGKYNKIGPWPVPAGHRGGQADCATVWLAGTKVSACGWATDRTIGIVASPALETGTGELATLLVRMRYDLQRG